MPNSSRSSSSSIDEVIEQQAATAANSNSNNVMRLEEGSWCNVEVSTTCIIHAIPIGEATTMTTTRSSSSYCCSAGAGGDEDSSIAAFTAPTLASLSRSFGATFDSTDESHDNSNNSDDDDNDDNNNVVTASPGGGGDDVILVMDEETGGVESSIVATATAKSIFFVDFGRCNNQIETVLQTAISTEDTIATAATATTTTTATAVIHPCTARAEFVSATFIKKTADVVVGITLASADPTEDCSCSCIRIAAIHQDGIFNHANSPLRVGDQLLSISGQSCFELETATAAQHLLEQATGIVSLVARNPTGSVQYIETMVEKPSPQAPVGIAMKNTDYGSLMISNVAATGLFAHSLLNVGDRVISINNEYCPQGLSVQAAIDMIRDTPRFVSILTETQSRAGVVVPSAEVGLQGTVIPTDAQGRPLSAAARNNKGWRRHLCSIILTVMLAIVVVDLLVFHPL